MGSSRWPLKVRLHLSISTALMRPRRPKQYCLQLDIALWCENQIEHSIWDESLLFSNCARSLEFSSSSTLAGLSTTFVGSSRWPLKVRLHLSIRTALMRPRRPKQYCLQLDIALWCENQIEHSIWDESLLFSNCARSLEFSSSSTLAGLSTTFVGSSRWPLKVRLHLSISTALMRPRRPKQYCLQLKKKYIYIYIYYAIKITLKNLISLVLKLH